mmetsp:Transcript_93536/g.288529  ORF Transcript_93536/g.288529 Transcript_93536/m.288529 type:complete len:98 (+) Transcript_93536:127-420(+)
MGETGARKSTDPRAKASTAELDAKKETDRETYRALGGNLVCCTPRPAGLHACKFAPAHAARVAQRVAMDDVGVTRWYPRPLGRVKRASMLVTLRNWA